MASVETVRSNAARPVRATNGAPHAASAGELVAPGWPLGVARIVIGFLWFQQLLWKLPPDFGCGPRGDQGLCDWIGREIANPLIPLYAEFLKAVVLPNLSVLGWFIWLTEAAIAVSLLFGILTRLGGLLGFGQAMNLFVGLSAVPHEWYWTYLMLALLCALFALTGAGRWLGVDRYLLPRVRGTPLERLV